jgi:antirestriction protein ArdC
MLRLYTVFNIEQCEGLGVKVPAPVKNANEPIPACEGIVAAMPQCPRIKGDSRAFYSPHEDFVGIPPKETFTKAEEYYCALFHELVHSTGHASRVKREMSGRMGSESYSKEELVAEMGAAFLCGHAGIEQATIENSAAYIANWLGRLKEDKKLVILAGAAAQKATDFILDRKFETEEAVA